MTGLPEGREGDTLPPPYYIVGDACEIADCTTRQFYFWKERGWLPFAPLDDGILRLTQDQVRLLRAFRAQLERPIGEVARDLITLTVEKERSVGQDHQPGGGEGEAGAREPG